MLSRILINLRSSRIALRIAVHLTLTLRHNASLRRSVNVRTT